MPFPGGPPRLVPTNEHTFLRGTQITDLNGLVRFKTIYPGWYPGRTLHVHLKVHTGGTITGAESNALAPKSSQVGTLKGYSGGHVCHIGQLFFPEQVTAAVALTEPYSHSKIERVLLADDMVFGPQSGESSMLSLSRLNGYAGSPEYAGSVKLMINTKAAYF